MCKRHFSPRSCVLWRWLIINARTHAALPRSHSLVFSRFFPTTSSALLLRDFHPHRGAAYRDEDNGGKRGDDNIVSRNSGIFCHVLVREGTSRSSSRSALRTPGRIFPARIPEGDIVAKNSENPFGHAEFRQLFAVTEDLWLARHRIISREWVSLSPRREEQDSSAE